MIRFLPSIQPWFRRPSSHAFCMVGTSSFMARKPTRRRVPCARERRGETSSAVVAAMNSRRLIVLPHRRGRTARPPTSRARQVYAFHYAGQEQRGIPGHLLLLTRSWDTDESETSGCGTFRTCSDGLRSLIG